MHTSSEKCNLSEVLKGKELVVRLLVTEVKQLCFRCGDESTKWVVKYLVLQADPCFVSGKYIVEYKSNNNTSCNLFLFQIFFM